MNILILGGTGAMGTHLVSILNMRGTKCVVTSRSIRNNSENIEYAQGNAHDTHFLISLLAQRRWDAIVDFMTYSTQEFMDRYNLLLDATKHYIFFSSSRVYAESHDPITECSPRLLDICNDKEYLKTDEYALKKARQEDVLINSGKLNWTIIRPYVTFSEYRLQLSPLEKEHWLYRALKGRTIVFSKDLADRVTTFTYGFDVARSIASIIGNEKAKGETFHITNDYTIKWSEILSAYLDVIQKVTHNRPNVKMIDHWKPFLGGNQYQVRWDRLYNRVFDNKKINQFIDTTTFKPTMQAIEDCITAFIANPKFRKIRWKNEAQKDRLTGEWTSLSEIDGVCEKIKYLIVRLGLY